VELLESILKGTPMIFFQKSAKIASGIELAVLPPYFWNCIADKKTPIVENCGCARVAL